MGPVLLQEESGVLGENLRCLVESNWTTLSTQHMWPRWLYSDNYVEPEPKPSHNDETHAPPQCHQHMNPFPFQDWRNAFRVKDIIKIIWSWFSSVTACGYGVAIRIQSVRPFELHNNVWGTIPLLVLQHLQRWCPWYLTRADPYSIPFFQQWFQDCHDQR